VPREPRQPPPPAPARLQDERLSRLEAALAEGRAREDAWVEAWVRRTGRLPPRKVRRKWEKQWRKQAERAAKRVEREAKRARSRNPVKGGVFATMAVVLVLMAMAQPRLLWWLVFVALGFFLAAARHLERPRRDALKDAELLPGAEAFQLRMGSGPRAVTDALHGAELGRGEAVDPRAPKQPPGGAAPTPGEAMDPRVAKVDTLCGKLLAEFRGGPAVLREVVHAPERTVEALRKGCHELARRERELRALSTPEESRRLESEREALATRISTETDTVVRERLTGALAALDEQRRQRAELTTAANRLEAEHTRLYYTLESLYAQVLRVRSADTAGEDLAGAGLRRSMEQLGAEVDAVTQALEEVHRPGDGRVRTR
jgi:hypothetical protein